MASVAVTPLKQVRRWVVKIGSALLTADGRGISREVLKPWIDQLVGLHQAGCEVVLVSSGAVAEGMARMGWRKRPGHLNELQAAAAIGQMGLVQAYEACFSKRGIHTAQVLLTRGDLEDRQRYLNARSTLRALLRHRVIPVINENDTVATDELRFGDNDTLAALVSNLVEAELLLLLTDQKGLYDADPRFDDAAKLIEHARVDDALLDRVAGDSASGYGRGGMVTKVRASRLAARSGALTLIASGREAGVIDRVRCGDNPGTLLLPAQGPNAARKQWLAGQLQAKGRLVLDAGAVEMLTRHGKSLLAAGVLSVVGQFRRGDLVVCCDARGLELARGLVNYSAEESSRIIGRSSEEFESILGYIDEDELIHRDNLVLV